ncbi:MAG: LptE family protein [Bacteroidota bacterium]
MIKNYRIPYVFFLLSIGILSGCSVKFNLTGGTVDPRLQTLSVETFGNEAPIVVPFLAIEVTNQLQDRFLSQSRLSLTTGDADVQISGRITNYAITPVAISASSDPNQERFTASQNRLTIAISVKFDNTIDPNESWEQSFSGFVDFNSELDFASIERDRVDEILEQLTQDVFNKSIGKW